MSHIKNHQAFTLVELIVVIIILAILATIAFLSFNSYSSSTRDSVRLSDISNIAKWLVVQYSIWWYYILPDNNVSLLSWSTIIWYQWKAWTNVLSTIKISSNSWKDPIDNAYYTYNTNLTKNKYQLSWFLESKWSVINRTSSINNLNLTNQINQTYSTTYTNRYPYTKWDSIWVILSYTWWTGSMIYTPLEDSWTWIDVSSWTQVSWRIVINNNTDSSTWVSVGSMSGYTTYAIVTTVPIIQSYTMCTAKWQTYTWVTKYSDSYWICDTPDRVVCTWVWVWQSWSMCNVWATTTVWRNTVPAQSPGDGTATLPTNRVQSVQWNYYQWWRNTNVTSTIASAWPVASETNTNFYTNWVANYDWLETKNDNLWWWTNTTTSTWYYSNQTTANQALMQWPCWFWYHVPTIKEWCDLITSINSWITCTANWQNDTSIASTLKLPLSGHRDAAGATYYYQNTYGNFWASSPNSIRGYSLVMTSSQVYPLFNNGRANSFTIRCLKN